MAHPYLGFCPYLPLASVVEFADWEIGPLSSFDGRWSDPRFESRAKEFLGKFVAWDGAAIERPSILCRRGAKVDGALPSAAQIDALERAIAFALLEKNPRHSAKTKDQAFGLATSDNAEVHFWPIDLEDGRVTVVTGLMLRTTDGGYRLADSNLSIRPPLDLHVHSGCLALNPAVLEAIYALTLGSAMNPGADASADRLRVAIGWFIKAWRNTATVHWWERIVFLKTAFEAITDSEKSHISAGWLRAFFQAIPGTTPADSAVLMWSPAEKANRTRIWVDKKGAQHKDSVTDLEHWFMEFAAARNKIIHEGLEPSLDYYESGSLYNGHMVFTAEFLLRAVVKVAMFNNGAHGVWRPHSAGQ